MLEKDKKEIYNRIIESASLMVIKMLNESDIAGFREGDLISREDAQDIASEELNYSYIKDGIDYINSNPSMKSFYKSFHIRNIIPNKQVATIATDGKNVYYNPEYIETLSAKEKAFVILHQGFHILLSHKASSFEENVENDKTVNAFIENKWPEFKGMTKKLNGYIDENDSSIVNDKIDELYKYILTYTSGKYNTVTVNLENGRGVPVKIPNYDQNDTITGYESDHIYQVVVEKDKRDFLDSTVYTENGGECAIGLLENDELLKVIKSIIKSLKNGWII